MVIKEAKFDLCRSGNGICTSYCNPLGQLHIQILQGLAVLKFSHQCFPSLFPLSKNPYLYSTCRQVCAPLGRDQLTIFRYSGLVVNQHYR